MGKLEEAKEIVDKFYNKRNTNKDDEYLFVEALNYIIDSTGDPEYVSALGGYYYGKKRFDLALKYYSIASEDNEKYALNGLGYIYYYGRTGEVNYDLAFKYYKRASDLGVDEATMKLSDMYSKGLGAKKDLKKSYDILIKLYEREKNSDLVYSIYPEVVIRLSSYWIKEEKYEDCFYALIKAKNFIKSRLVYNDFFGEYTNMESIINKIYECVSFDKLEMDIYDIFYYFKNIGKVIFLYNGKEYCINSQMDGNAVSLEFNGKWYHDARDFLMNAKIDNKRISSISYDIYACRGE